MIKKIFSYVFVIVIVVLSMQLVINFLKTEHDVNYTLTVNDENVEIIKIVLNSEDDLIKKCKDLDFALLALHGKFGEDGTVQSVLKL